MQYRIQFLDVIASVILDLVADARDAASAIALVVDLDWPPTAVSMRVLDEEASAVRRRSAAVTQIMIRAALSAGAMLFASVAASQFGSSSIRARGAACDISDTPPAKLCRKSSFCGRSVG